MLEDIERIEVVRGPGGALWGANAVNGVINILTKHTRDTQGNLVSAVAGNEERSAINARHGGSFGNDGTYRVYAKAFDRGSSVKPSGSEAYDAWDGARLGFRADWSDEFTLQGDAYKTSEEQYRYHYSLIPPNMPIEEQTIVYEGVNLLGRWAKKYDEGAQLSVQAYVDWARRDEPINFIDDRTIYDIETQYNFAPIGTHEFIAGAGVRYITDNKIGDNNVSFSPQRRHDFIYNGFIQDRIALVQDAIFLTVGAKFEHNEFSGTENQPNVRLHWQAPHDQTVWASVSKAVRTPTPLEEDLTSTAGTGPNLRVAFVPNDDAKAEKLTAYEIGYRNQVTPALSVDLSTFYNDYDKLQTFTVGSPAIVNNGRGPFHLFIPVKFTNDMTGRSHGAEATINWTINANMKIAFDYSYLHLTVHALNPTQEGAETLYPTHQVGTQLFWNISNNWTFDTSVAYVDDLPGAKVEDYVRMDLNLGLKVSENLRLNLVGQNLLDNRHREFAMLTDLNVAEIERGIFGKVTWDF
jgi:iron complex outermembrane receptor protein